MTESSFDNHKSTNARQLETLYEIAETLAKSSGQRELLRNILYILERTQNMTNSTVMLVTGDDEELVIEACQTAVDAPSEEARYRRGEGIIGHVLATGKAELISCVADEPRFKGRLYGRSQDIRRNISFICVPIILGNETIGTLSADMPFQPTSELRKSARFLSIVASVIAHDVKNRRMVRLETEQLQSENVRLRNELKTQYRPENMIGNSRQMRDVFLKIHQVASVNTTVLIRGESGTGKELVASAVHYNSNRADAPFIRVNCAALSENLLESELFGHEKGAFTGATGLRIGRIEEANGGTLFLDEIGDFSPAVQVKLLRVIQEKQFERVGSNTTMKADVRFITATNRNLEDAVEDGTFRSDLYYRINVFPIFLPPLRERRNDILLLANHFAEKFSEEMEKKITRISTPAINMLTAYHWPGNVRELENCIEHAVLLSTDGAIHGHDLPPTLQMPEESSEGPPRGNLKQQVEILEKDLIVDSLKRNQGNITAASKELGISSRMLRYKIENLKIDYKRLFVKGKRRKSKLSS